MQHLQTAVVGDRDVTAEIRAAGLSVNATTDVDIAHLPKTLRARWDQEGILFRASTEPAWDIRTRYWWRQRFPAGRKVVIDHRYQPITGSSYTTVGDPPSNLMEMAKNSGLAGACLPPKALAAVPAVYAAASRAWHGGYEAPTVFISTTDYILKTGANWKGPIATFHLAVDKMAATNIMGFCWPSGLKQTSPTTYETTIQNFRPTRDLELLVIHPQSANEPH